MCSVSEFFKGSLALARHNLTMSLQKIQEMCEKCVYFLNGTFFWPNKKNLAVPQSR